MGDPPGGRSIMGNSQIADGTYDSSGDTDLLHLGGRVGLFDSAREEDKARAVVERSAFI